MVMVTGGGGWRGSRGAAVVTAGVRERYDALHTCDGNANEDAKLTATGPQPAPDRPRAQGDTLTFAGDITGMQHILTMPGLQPISESRGTDVQLVVCFLQDRIQTSSCRGYSPSVSSAQGRHDAWRCGADTWRRAGKRVKRVRLCLLYPVLTLRLCIVFPARLRRPGV